VDQESVGSIRTVTVGDTSVGEPDSREETVMDVSGRNRNIISPESRKTTRHQAASSDLMSNAPEDVEATVHESPERGAKMGDKRRLKIINEEAKLRGMGWDALRQALGRYADEGDVQMCSMLSVVAPQELGVEKRRIARFLDSYNGLFRAFRRSEFSIDTTCQISSLICTCTPQLRMCGNIQR
jgi:hypothetical protein